MGTSESEGAAPLIGWNSSGSKRVVSPAAAAKVRGAAGKRCDIAPHYGALKRTFSFLLSAPIEMMQSPLKSCLCPALPSAGQARGRILEWHRLFRDEAGAKARPSFGMLKPSTAKMTDSAIAMKMASLMLPPFLSSSFKRKFWLCGWGIASVGMPENDEA